MFPLTRIRPLRIAAGRGAQDGLLRRDERPPPTPPAGVGGGLSSVGPASGQTAEPAFQSAQFMFQPLRPLSGAIVLSPVFSTTTTSPMSELL